MKPKFRSIAAAFAPFSRASLIICASLCAATSANADQTWTGASDGDWANTANWLDGALPGATETAIFDANSTANLSITLGANRAIRGINFSSPAGPVTINTGSNLTLGFGGINMASATQNLTINAPVIAASEGKQTWNIATGRSVTLAAGPTKATVSACPLQISTTGTATFSTVLVGTTPTATTNLIIDPANNPWITLGTNDWAGLNAGNVVASTYTDATTALVAGVVNDVKANLTGVNPTDVAAIRFNEATPYDVTVSNSGTSRTMTARGILVTANSGGGSIGANLRNNGFVRPNRTSGNPSFNIIQNSAADFTIGAHLSNASSGVAVRLVKSGPGKLILLQDNSYSAGTYIDAGVVQFGNGSAVSGFAGYGFPGTGDIINNGEIVFNLTTEKTLVHNISGTGSLTQMGTGILNLTTSVSTFTGAVNLTGGTLGVTTMDNLGAGTEININGGIFKFLGAIDPTFRNINIGASGATFDTNGNNITFGNSLASGSAGSLTKTGAGTLTLAVDNDYTGGTNVNAGTLQVEASLSATGPGAVTVNSGGTLAGSGAIAGTANIKSGGILAPGSSVGMLTLGGLDLDAGSSCVFEFSNSPDNDKVAVSTSGGLTIDGGAITLLQEGTSTPFTTPGTYNLISYSGSIGGAGVPALSVANQQPGFSYTFGTSGGFVTLTIATTGIVSEWGNTGGGTWGSTSNWTNNTVPDAVGATANFFGAITAPSTVTLDGARTLGAITFDHGTNSYTITQGSGGSIILDNGTLPTAIANNNGNHEIAASITLATNTSVTSVAADDATVLSGVISGAAGKNLEKTGPGGLSLLGANDFAGDLTLGGGSTIFANDGLGQGDLTISGASLVWASGNSQDISDRTVTFGASPVTFDTNGNDVELLAGPIGGGGSAGFVKAGLGRLTFGESPTFTGGVTISAGVLQLGAGGSTGAVSGNIVNNAALDVNLADGASLANLISGTGSLAHAGTGVLSLNAANTFSGDTSISTGTATLLLGDANALQNSTLQYEGTGGTLNFGALTATTLGGLAGNKNLPLLNASSSAVALTVGGNNVSATYSGVLSGADASLTKLGTGELTLTKAQTYTGSTTVNGGKLILDSAGAISGTSVSVTGAGQMQINSGSIKVPVMNLGVGSGGLYMLGGTSTISGAVNAAGSTGSTNSGPVLVYGGTLSASSIILGRGGLNQSTDPAQAPIDTNLYLAGGDVNVSGNLYVGTFSDQPNSSVVTRIDAGTLTVDGAIVVGLNNGGRWSMVDVNGGTLLSTSSGVDMGVVLGGPWAGKAALLVRSGTATVKRIQLGQAAVAGSGLVSLTGGELYVGADGILQGSTAPTFTSEIRLGGGTLGAKANWTSSLPVTTTATTSSVIKAADGSGNPFDITLSGTITGTGNIEKAGDGTLTLSGNYGFAGDTKVFAGQLKVQSKTFNDTTGVYVDAASGATLNLDYSGGDRVAYFYINDNLQADGVYGAVGSGAQFETSAITGSGLLYVNTEVPVSGYATWATANAGGQDPDGDFDNDGVSNGVEYFLGQTGSNFTANPGLVGGTVTWTNGGNIASSAYGTEFVVQTSTNLVSWTDVLVTDPNLNNLAGSVSYTPTGAGKQFVRLKVTPN